MIRPFTLCLAYYENPVMLIRQMSALAELPADLRAALSLIVVDDCSPAPLAAYDAFNLARTYKPDAFSARLYRMNVNVPWNQDACRNLAVAEAWGEWVLLTDMDHVPTAALWNRLMKGDLDRRLAYTFKRVSAPDMSPYKPHPNSYAMTRKLYDAAGGYDERFAGVYGTDGMFKGRLRDVARVVEVKEALIRYPREVVPDASTRTLERKSEANEEKRQALKREIKDSGDTTPVRGRFPWARLR